jgi:hypothetical protein
VVGRTGENFGVEKRWKKKKNRARRMGFSSIQKTASTGSFATGALVGANSLQQNTCCCPLGYTKKYPGIIVTSS